MQNYQELSRLQKLQLQVVQEHKLIRSGYHLIQAVKNSEKTTAKNGFVIVERTTQDIRERAIEIKHLLTEVFQLLGNYSPERVLWTMQTMFQNL